MERRAARRIRKPIKTNEKFNKHKRKDLKAKTKLLNENLKTP